MFNTQKQGNNSRNKNSLVNSVESGVSWVELDGGEDSISGWSSSISTSNSWSSSICGGKWSSSNSWGSSISSGNSWSSSDGWGSSIRSGNSWSSSDGWGSSISSGNSWSSSDGWSSSICGSKRSSSISGSNSWGSGISVWESNLGRSLHNTSLGSIISLEESSLSLISISVRSSHSSKGIARLLLGRVDVLVSVGNI